MGKREELVGIAHSRRLLHGMVQRGQIVLACAEGESHLAIAKRLGISHATVGRWGRRYHDHGIEGLQDEQGTSRPRTHGAPQPVAQVLNTALQSRPPHATHGSVLLTLVQRTGISRSTVHRWFHLLNLQPHRHRHQKFLSFLQQIDGSVPKSLEVHLSIDNDCTHQHAKVKR